MRLQAYYACFTMRDNKSGKSPQAWLPLYFDKQDDDTPQQTEDEIKELQEELAYFNSIPPEQLWSKKAED